MLKSTEILVSAVGFRTKEKLGVSQTVSEACLKTSYIKMFYVNTYINYSIYK